MENYLNPALSARERAEDLLSKLSLEEKMALTTPVAGRSRKFYADVRLS